MNNIRSVVLPALSLFIIIVASPAGSAKAGTSEAPCHWMMGKVEADGSLQEWKDMPTTFFEDGRVMLGIGNDSNFLYLFLRTDEVNTIRAVQMSGISLWLDSRGKKKKDLCFHYRGGPTMDELQEAGLVDTQGFDGQMRDERHQRMMTRRDEASNKITLTDKHLNLEQVIPSDGSQGPTVACGFDHSFYVYEISIPLQDHDIDYYGFNAEPGQKVGIGIKWGGQPDRGMMKNGPPGGIDTGPGGGMPGGMGGGRGDMGGGRGGMRGDRMQPPEEIELWIKTELATSAPEKQ